MMDLNGRDIFDDLFDDNQQTTEIFKLLQETFKLGNEMDAHISSLEAGNSLQPQLPSSDSDEDDASENSQSHTAYAKLLLKFQKKHPRPYHAALQRLNLIRQNVKVTDAIDDMGNQPHVKPKHKPIKTVLVKQNTLNTIINIDLLLGKSWTEVSEILFNYFTKHDKSLIARVPLEEFKHFYKQAIKYPLFMLQLPPEMHEFTIKRDSMFSEFYCFDEHKVSNCTVHITPVVCYEIYTGHVPQCMTVDYYMDFCNGNAFSNNDEHSNEEPYVLMRATYNTKILTASAASSLINSLNCFYKNLSEIKENEMHLRLFNKDVIPFKHSDVVDVVEELSIT